MMNNGYLMQAVARQRMEEVARAARTYADRQANAVAGSAPRRTRNRRHVAKPRLAHVIRG